VQPSDLRSGMRARRSRASAELSESSKSRKQIHRDLSALIEREREKDGYDLIDKESGLTALTSGWMHVDEPNPELRHRAGLAQNITVEHGKGSSVLVSNSFS
jgi:hypothetical protein